MQEEKDIDEMNEEQEREREKDKEKEIIGERLRNTRENEEGKRDEDERRVEQTEHELMLRAGRKRARGWSDGYARRVLPRTARLLTIAC